MKSVSISVKDSALSVYSMNLSACYPSNRFSLCIYSFHYSIKSPPVHSRPLKMLLPMFPHHMAVVISLDSLNPVPLTALPNLTVNSRTAPPAFPCKYFIAVSANDFRCERIAFRTVGIGICSMFFQIRLSAFYSKLHTLPYFL